MTMNPLIPGVLALVFCAAGSAAVAQGRGFEGQRTADLGDGTYLNPIMAGDHPDPSILKDGDDYYMTFSSFDAYPGLVIWHSRDLVNWEPMYRNGKKIGRQGTGGLVPRKSFYRRVPFRYFA